MSPFDNVPQRDVKVSGKGMGAGGAKVSAAGTPHQALIRPPNPQPALKATAHTTSGKREKIEPTLSRNA